MLKKAMLDPIGDTVAFRVGPRSIPPAALSRSLCNLKSQAEDFHRPLNQKSS